LVPLREIGRRPALSPRHQASTNQKRGSGKGRRKTAVPAVWRAVLFGASFLVVFFAVALAVINIQGGRPRPLPGIAELGLQEPDSDPTEPELAPAPHVEPEPTPLPIDAATPPAPVETATQAPPQVAQPRPTPPVVAAPPQVAMLPPLPPPRQDRGTLVFVIDDAGHNLHQLEPFLNFPGALTIAVLPGLPHSVEAARRIREAGMEVFLHQPMEAVGGEDPGPGAIYSWMDEAEILEVLHRNLAEVGPVAGMNNHQGSRITADERIMEIVLAFSREQGIRFLDSKTTAVSAASAVARRMGMTIGTRNVFIDNEQSRASMNRAIGEGRTIASRNGNAVMIGHVWSPALAPLLKDLYRELVDQGFTFATASQLIDEASR